MEKLCNHRYHEQGCQHCDDAVGSLLKNEFKDKLTTIRNTMKANQQFYVNEWDSEFGWRYPELKQLLDAYLEGGV